jgi:hypothetical protein
MLSSPEQGQPLILYVSVTHSVVSRALVVEKEAAHKGATMKQQYPVYFVSEVLVGSKKYYSEVEKICYTIVMSSRKLWHYFEAHTIRVLTDQPLHDIFGNKDSSRRIGKWAIELLEYVVDFEKRSAIKSQILADFMVDWAEPRSQEDNSTQESPWLVHYDGGWGSTGAGGYRNPSITLRGKAALCSESAFNQ